MCLGVEDCYCLFQKIENSLMAWCWWVLLIAALFRTGFMVLLISIGSNTYRRYKHQYWTLYQMPEIVTGVHVAWLGLWSIFSKDRAVQLEELGTSSEACLLFGEWKCSIKRWYDQRQSKEKTFENVPLAGVGEQGRWAWKEQTQVFRLPAHSFQQHFAAGFGDPHVQAGNDLKEKYSTQNHVLLWCWACPSQQDWTF